MNWQIICWVLACGLFVLATFWNPQPPRFSLVSAGLAFLTAGLLVPLL